jgi:hypothetical protein
MAGFGHEHQEEGSRVQVQGYQTHDPTDARIAELEAAVARLRSLLGKLVQSLEENLEAHEAREDRPCVRVAREIIKEARDAR